MTTNGASIARAQRPLPIKPEVCVIGDRLAVFMGADCKFLTLEAAEAFVRRMQGEVGRLRGQQAAAQGAEA